MAKVIQIDGKAGRKARATVGLVPAVIGGTPAIGPSGQQLMMDRSGKLVPSAEDLRLWKLGEQWAKAELAKRPKRRLGHTA